MVSESTLECDRVCKIEGPYRREKIDGQPGIYLKSIELKRPSNFELGRDEDVARFNEGRLYYSISIRISHFLGPSEDNGISHDGLG